MNATNDDKDYERIIKEIRLDRQMKRKRLFEQAKRANAKSVEKTKKTD
jgi:hypothetical protein